LLTTTGDRNAGQGQNLFDRMNRIKSDRAGRSKGQWGQVSTFDKILTATDCTVFRMNMSPDKMSNVETWV